MSQNCFIVRTTCCTVRAVFVHIYCFNAVKVLQYQFLLFRFEYLLTVLYADFTTLLVLKTTCINNISTNDMLLISFTFHLLPVLSHTTYHCINCLLLLVSCACYFYFKILYIGTTLSILKAGKSIIQILYYVFYKLLK
jgi:hypothetical protein